MFHVKHSKQHKNISTINLSPCHNKGKERLIIGEQKKTKDIILTRFGQKRCG